VSLYVISRATISTAVKNNKWSKKFDIRPHCHRRRTVQSYLSGGVPICSAMWAHWRHLVNTIELELPSAHQSPQLKWQIDRIIRVCTAHGRVSSGHWCHLANRIQIVHTGATWRIRLNACFLSPPKSNC